MSALKNVHSDEKIQNYSHIRNDLPDNDRCGGVFLYYKNDLPVKNRIDLQFPNTIVAEMSISRKQIFFITSYRKPSQSDAEFTSHCGQFDNILNKIALAKFFYDHNHR